MSGVTEGDGSTHGQRAGRDQDEEFMRFVQERQAALRRTAYLVTGSWTDGDDLLQESLTKVYLAWPRIESPAAAFSYTRTTMVRTWLNQHRRALTEVAVETLPEGRADEPDTALAVSLRGLLDDLPPAHRAVVVLRFYEDLTVPQIATALRLPEGTVKSQLSRALASLRGRLAQDGEVTT